MTIGWSSKPLGGEAEPIQREFKFTNADFRYLADFLKENTGIALSQNKADMIYARLARRIRVLGLTSFRAYISTLEGSAGAEERGHLVNALTTNLTRFFREPHHFEHLQNQAIDETLAYIKNLDEKRVRLWSAGCASGEEAYSMAMILRSKLPDNLGVDAKILATDMDTNVLATAAEGRYPSEALEMVPPEMRSLYAKLLRREANLNWQMRNNVRSLITFKRLNLIREWPMRGPFDVIFCRNVMIYFDKVTTKAVLRRFTDILRPGGWLYIGHSENIIGMDDRLERVAGTTYRRVAE